MKSNVNKKIIIDKGHPIYMGIDVHKRTWSITLVHQGETIQKVTVPADWLTFRKFLEGYQDYEVRSVYEAGFSGFWLHRKLESLGVINIVTAPNKLPVQVGDRVKTDKRDSEKLARYLSKDLLKGIYIPSEKQVEHRHLLRAREQLKRKRQAIINQIKGTLHQYGLEVETPGLTLKACKRITSMDLSESVKSTIEIQLKVFEVLTMQMKELVHKAETIALSEMYRADYELLRTVPGLGPLGALSLL